MKWVIWTIDDVISKPQVLLTNLLYIRNINSSVS